MVELRIIRGETNGPVVVRVGFRILAQVQEHISSVKVKEGILVVALNGQVVVANGIFKLPKMEMRQTLVVVVELVLFDIYCFVELFKGQLELFFLKERET